MTADVQELEALFEEVEQASKGDFAKWYSSQPEERRRIFLSKQFKDYSQSRTQSREFSNAGSAPKDASGEASPHALLAIPRALTSSNAWRKLSPGARDLYYYLLLRSNTRSFKDVWPGADTMENDLNIDRRTRWKYERALVAAKILKIYQPGERDLSGQLHRSRRFSFTITRFINEDRRAYNEKRGREIYPPLRDMHALWQEVERVSARAGYDARQIKDRAAASRLVLDQVAKRMKITGIDERGRVRASIHSKLYPKEIAETQLPDNVLLFPEPNNDDLIINPKETWQSFEKKLHKALSEAAAKVAGQTMFNFAQALEQAAQHKNTASR